MWKAGASPRQFRFPCGNSSNPPTCCHIALESLPMKREGEAPNVLYFVAFRFMRGRVSDVEDSAQDVACVEREELLKTRVPSHLCGMCGKLVYMAVGRSCNLPTQRPLANRKHHRLFGQSHRLVAFFPPNVDDALHLYSSPLVYAKTDSAGVSL